MAIAAPSLRFTRRHALLSAAGVGVLAAGLVGAAWTFQRLLLYQPDTDTRPPFIHGVKVEVVHLTTADGEHITGWYLPPVGDRPVMLFLNGRMGGLAIQRGRWRRIAREGVGFLAVNYRGYGGSTGKPTEWGLQQDARAAYAWLAGHYSADRIVIHGFSLGSGVAVRLAAEHHARALILEAPFTGLDDVAAARSPIVPIGWLLRDRYPSRDWIGRVRMPILIAHGDKDSVVPFQDGERLYEMSPTPKRFIEMRGSDHNTLTRDGLYDHIWSFLAVTAPEA